MRKKIGMALAGVSILLIALLVYLFWPIKFAVKTDDLQGRDKAFYYVKWVQVTGSDWMITGDQNGEYPEAEYVVLQGESPDIVKNYDIASAGNVYIIYGEYVGEEEFMGERFSVYNSTGWDILYPIKRNSALLFLPKGCLTRTDVIGMELNKARVACFLVILLLITECILLVKYMRKPH